jgi:hypothetical protein
MSASFFKAIQEGDRDKVERMLRKTPDLILARDKNNLSPVMTAMYYHEFEVAACSWTAWSSSDRLRSGGDGEIGTYDQQSGAQARACQRFL